MYEFVKSHALLIAVVADVPVFDGFQWCDDARVDAGLFANFANRRDLRGLAGIDDAFRQLPTALGANTHERNLDVAGDVAIHHAAGGNLAHRWKALAWHDR